MTIINKELKFSPIQFEYNSLRTFPPQKVQNLSSGSWQQLANTTRFDLMDHVQQLRHVRGGHIDVLLPRKLSALERLHTFLQRNILQPHLRRERGWVDVLHEYVVHIELGGQWKIAAFVILVRIHFEQNGPFLHKHDC